MLEDKWLIIFGVPAIMVLAIMAWRKARALATRIADVKREMAEHPQDPYQALSELYDKPQKRGKK